MTDWKKKMLAGLLVVMWAGLAYWQWGTFEEPVHVPLTNVTGQAPSGQRPTANRSGSRVKMDLLASAGAQRQATFTAPRNIFAVPSSDGVLPGESERVSESQASHHSSAQTPSEQLTEAQVAPYRYLGFLRIGDRREKDMAVLGKDDEVMVLKVGDHVEGHLVLKAITLDSVTIRDTNTRLDQKVLLTEDVPIEE
jgi:hypothetical protein